jgi:hypothetical protein
MITAHSTLRLFFGERRRRVVEHDDPADMGTCFGMEMTLEPAAAPPVVAKKSARSQPWWQRRVTRKPVGA